MSDEPTPDAPDERTTTLEDELVSAVLDGEATAAERRLVDEDPRLHARLETFTRVRAAVVPGPTPDGAARDHTIAAALAAAAPASTGPQPSAPTDLHLARAHRRRRIATVIAAAAVAVVAIPLLALALGGGGAKDNATSTGAAVGESSNKLSSDAAPSSSTTTQPPPQDAQAGLVGPVFVGDLGSITSIDQLRFEVSAALADRSARIGAPEVDGPTSNGPTSTVPEAAVPDERPDDRLSSNDDALKCAGAVAVADPSVGVPVMTSTALWRGVPAFVIAYQTSAAGPGAPQPVIVVTGADCAVIARTAG